MERVDGGPAFPASSKWRTEMEGVTLRDYFAAAALPAIVSAYVEANGRCIGTDHVKQNCSVLAYNFADAMLAERAK